MPKPGGDKWHIERRDGARQLNLRYTVEPDYLFFLGEHINELENLPSFVRIREAILSSPVLTRAFLGRGHGSSADAVKIALLNYLFPLAAALLQAIDEGGQWDTELKKGLGLLDEFLQKDTYPVTLYAPLLNFKSNSDNVELIDGICVRAISDTRLESYVNTTSLFMGTAKLHQLLMLEFQLETTIELPRESPYFPPNAGQFQAKCDGLLKAFRLIRPGAIGLAFAGGTSSGPFGPGPSWMTGLRLDRLYGDVYEFSASDSQKIAELVPRIGSVESDARFALAIRRFMGSYEKPFDGDRLIDYWIALESLLVPDATTELSYRVSLRGAWLLAEAPGRNAVFWALRKSYDARSSFVHGDPKKVESQVVAHTEDHLRNLLLWCLNAGRTPTKEVLDSTVLGQK